MGLSEPVRIGLDARYAFRAQRRGIGEYVAALIQHLPAVSDSCDQFVLYVDGHAQLDAVALTDSRMWVRRLRASNPLVWEEIALPAAAGGDRVDMLHLTSNYGPSRPPCPTIYTIHDTIEFVRTSFGRANLSWRHALGRNIRTHTLPRQAKQARGILTASLAAKRDIATCFGLAPDRIRVIPLGVSEEFHPDSSKTGGDVHPHLPAQPYVLALGALDPRKNGSVLVRAFAETQQYLPNYKLWILGIEQPDRYPLPMSPKPAWLELTGFVPRTVLVSAMQSATAFVYPSLYEGFGLPPIEAMACGVPVIVADHPAVCEAVGEAALRFQGTDVSGLARLLSDLLGNKALQTELALLGLRHAARFTWRETARQTYAAYRDALQVGRWSAA